MLRNTLSGWWRLTRYHYTSSSFLAAAVAGAIGWAHSENFVWERFAIATLALIVNQLALNMADDYFDFRNGIDRLKDWQLHTYTGGSGVLPSGAVSPAAVQRAFLALFGVGIALMLGLVLSGGAALLAVIGVGLFYSYFYTAPPFRLAYRGLGEVGFIVCFGPLIGAGVAYAATGQFLPEAVLMTLPLGLVQFAMIGIQEIVDRTEDAAGGKRTLVVRFGERFGVWMHIAGMSAAFMAVLVGYLFLQQPSGVLIVLLLLPRSVSTALDYARVFRKPRELAQRVSNFASFKIHNLMALGLMLAYFREGFTSSRPLAGGEAVALVIVGAYIPVAWMLTRRSPDARRPGIRVQQL